MRRLVEVPQDAQHGRAADGSLVLRADEAPVQTLSFRLHGEEPKADPHVCCVRVGQDGAGRLVVDEALLVTLCERCMCQSHGDTWLRCGDVVWICSIEAGC